MSDTSTQDFYTQQAAEARGPESESPGKQKRKRLLRIFLAAGASLVVVAGLVAGGGFLYVNHEVGSIQRIHVAALDAKDQPGAPPGSLTILLTASGLFSGQDTPTGLIELIHLNANHRGGAAISFPANVLVSVPGHGKQRLGETLALGGPSLMIETLERLTGVRINHYSQITFSGLPRVVGSMGGVSVDVPYPVTSFGFHFHAGVNRITGSNALAYVRQVRVGEVARTALQENLLRAIMRKIANKRYFLATDWHVLDAIARVVSVDSDLSNSRLVSLALDVGHLESGASVSIDVPTAGSPDAGFTQPVHLRTRLAGKLWQAVRHDSVAQFAQRYPSTVTPIAPG